MSGAEFTTSTVFIFFFQPNYYRINGNLWHDTLEIVYKISILFAWWEAMWSQHEVRFHLFAATFVTKIKSNRNDWRRRRDDDNDDDDDDEDHGNGWRFSRLMQRKSQTATGSRWIVTKTNSQVFLRMPQAHSAGASRWIGERRTIYPNLYGFRCSNRCRCRVVCRTAHWHTGGVCFENVVLVFGHSHTPHGPQCESQSIVPVWPLLWRIDLFSTRRYARTQRFVLPTTVRILPR